MALLAVAMLLMAAAAASSQRGSGTIISKALGGEEVEGIVMLFPDQWRFDWDGRREDVPLAIPTLRQLFKDGTSFKHAYVPAPVCAPSRSCLASGREYDEAGVPNNFNNDYPVNDGEPTFYKQLRDAGGWWTMTTGKDDLTKATQPGANGTFHQKALGFSDAIRCSGKDDVLSGGPHEPYGLMLNSTTVDLEDGTPVNAYDSHKSCLHGGKGSPSLCDRTSYPDKLYEDNWTAENAKILLGRRPRDRPFFLEVSFPGPHPPFTVTASMRGLVANRTYPKPVDNKNGAADVCPSGQAEPYTGRQCAYGAEIENLDDRIRDVLQTVADTTPSRGAKVVVCFSSDHGTMLYDHGDQGKTMPWNPSASVPLVCKGPGITAGGVVATLPVATMDMAGTFLDIAGVALAPNMTTRSLSPLLTRGEEAAGEYRSYISSGLQNSPFNDPAADAALLRAGMAEARGEADAGARPAFGGGDGYNWRMAVRTVGSTIYKYICCKGKCNGSPSTAPKPDSDGYTRILYSVTDDVNDMQPLHNATLEEELRTLLPAGHCPAPPLSG